MKQIEFPLGLVEYIIILYICVLFICIYYYIPITYKLIILSIGESVTLSNPQLGILIISVGIANFIFGAICLILIYTKNILRL